MGAQLTLDLRTGRRQPRYRRASWVPGIPVHDQPPPEQDPGDPPGWEQDAMRWAPQLPLPLDEDPLPRRSLVRA